MLYSFAGKGDGCLPFYGRLVFDRKGSLYGTTRGTPRSISASSGTVYQLTPRARGTTKWAEQVLYCVTGTGTGGSGNNGACAIGWPVASRRSRVPVRFEFPDVKAKQEYDLSFSIEAAIAHVCLTA